MISIALIHVLTVEGTWINAMEWANLNFFCPVIKFFYFPKRFRNDHSFSDLKKKCCKMNENGLKYFVWETICTKTVSHRIGTNVPCLHWAQNWFQSQGDITNKFLFLYLEHFNAMSKIVEIGKHKIVSLLKTNSYVFIYIGWINNLDKIKIGCGLERYVR